MSLCFLSTTPLVFMPKRPVADNQNDPHVKELQENQSVYWNAIVFFSARVLSHCGFILSLLAIWLAWLIPTAILEGPAAPDIRTLKSRTKPPRRPMPSYVQTNVAPIILPANAADNQQPGRHVYFADAAPEATTVNQAMVAEPPPQTPVFLQSSLPSQTTVMLPSENAAGPSESLDSLVLDSDSSSRPSSLKRPGLSKFKLFRSYSLDVNPTSMTSDHDEVVSPLSTATLFLKGQRTSLPSSKPKSSRFPFRRCSVPVGQEPPSRTPKPTPRTMPYGPPYFATPPILLDKHYSTSLNTRPQFKHENFNSRAPESDCELSRGRTIRRVNLSSTVDRRHRPRSMSEDIASR